MKILIAPDKFKGSLSALEVAEAIAIGIQRALPSAILDLHPLADGGDGSVDILSSYLALTEIETSSKDPLGKPIHSSFHLGKDAAFIEMAKASGLVLLDPSDRNPLYTSTLGTGLLAREAMNHEVDTIYLFLGGSATNDGGMGFAQALGFRFIDHQGNELEPIGMNLGKVHRISIPPNPQHLLPKIVCLCDVKNPLLGPNGASHVFARQKGADDTMIESLEKGMEHFALVVENELGINIKTIEGGGAAGGIAAGLYGLCNAEIRSGIDTILSLSNFEEKLQESDIIISGEGRLDEQTLEGKVIKGVLDKCKAHQKELILFVGQNLLLPEVWQQEGIRNVSSVLSKASSIEEAIQKAAPMLENLAYEFFSTQF